MKWLENPKSVSKAELSENHNAVRIKSDKLSAKGGIRYHKASTAFSASYAADEDDAYYAEEWIMEYFVASGEDKREYLKAIGSDVVVSPRELRLMKLGNFYAVQARSRLSALEEIMNLGTSEASMLAQFEIFGD